MTAPFGPDYGFGLYVHWPYCSKICPYCDFNVYAAKDRESGGLLDAIRADISRHRDDYAAHPAIGTVYFGGGTPSLLSGAEIGAILDAARSSFGVSENAEITLEANPNDILRSDLEAWRSAGVTRLSIGVQSLQDDALAFLGRDHDAASAQQAVEAALNVFPSVSIDLIYARPGQSGAAWRAELEAALRLGAPHVSLYELTIEERTAFGRRAARGELVPMGDDQQADLYELTDEIMTGAGLPAYEVSNYAASPNHQSRHNLIYWRGGDWIGAGPGAHGRLSKGDGRYATEAARRPDDYAGNVTQTVALTALETAQELLVMGLRPAEGISIRRIETSAGRALGQTELDRFSDEGLIVLSGGRIALTPRGRLLADGIASALALTLEA